MEKFETKEVKLSDLIQWYIDSQPKKDWQILAIDPRLDVIIPKRKIEK